MAERLEARRAKDFARADRIRDGLTDAGIVIMDGKDGGYSWEATPNVDVAKLEALG